MQIATHIKPESQRVASLAFLEGYKEGRPMRELAELLPQELEATGQYEAAAVVRSFFANAKGQSCAGYSGDPAVVRRSPIRSGAEAERREG